MDLTTFVKSLLHYLELPVNHFCEVSIALSRVTRPPTTPIFHFLISKKERPRIFPATLTPNCHFDECFQANLLSPLISTNPHTENFDKSEAWTIVFFLGKKKKKVGSTYCRAWLTFSCNMRILSKLVCAFNFFFFLDCAQ